MNVISAKANPTNGTGTRFIALFDYFFFLRPILHPPVWTIVILGYFKDSKPNSLMPLIYILLLSSATASWAYIINQISDIDTDRVNDKLYFLPNCIISLKAAYIMAGLAFCTTLIIGFMVGKMICILYSVGLALGYIYSGKPFYGKNHPIVSSLSNGIAHGIIPFVTGYLAAGGNIETGFVCAIAYFFAVLAVFIGTTIPDIPGDFKVGKITPGVALGVNTSSIVMTVCLAVSLVLAFITGDITLTVVAALSLPLLFMAAAKPGDRWTKISIKLSILFLSLAACYRFWPYAIILLALFALTRIYYRKRFGLVYPRLT